LAKKYGFSFNDNKTKKIGFLREFVRQHLKEENEGKEAESAK